LEWAVALVLLIACANVANLLLAALSERRTELAVRQALGTNPWQLARELGGESLVFVAASGGLAMLLATWSVGMLNGQLSGHQSTRPVRG
jgi:ABC-type antimicrobial peptide transport system permease subunit